MPFNGSGVYTAPAADFPVVTQTVISSTHFNNTINDIATALSTCLTKDGQQVATANIPFGGFRATNVGITAIAGSVGTPAINVSDAATGLYRSAASELAVTVAGTQRARFDGTGLIVTGVGTFSGATSTTTLTASTSVVTPLVGNVADTTLNFQVNNAAKWGIATSAGVGGAAAYTLFPSGDATQDIGGPVTRIRTAYATIIDTGTAGSLSLRTNNGTQGFRLDHAASAVNFLTVQPAITGGQVIVYGNGSDADVGLQVGSKGVGSIGFHTDILVTAARQFQVLHTASATRNITVTGSNGGNPTISTTAGSLAITPDTTIAGGLNPNFTSAETAVTGNGTTVTVAHGLGVVPRSVFVVIRCKTAEFGYSIGDEVVVASHTLATVYADTTNVGIVLSSATALTIVRRDTFAQAAVTVANWKYVVRAWK